MKHIKFIISVLVCISLCVGYFYYLNVRNEGDPADKVDPTSVVSKLISKDIENHYPETPREVVELYSSIIKEFYTGKLSSEEIEKLCNQARLLFDEELLLNNPQEQHLEDLNTEISEYLREGKYISDYVVQRNADVTKYTFNDEEYASVKAVYYIRKGTDLDKTYEEYILRKDSSGRWKILYWTVTSPTVIK